MNGKLRERVIAEWRGYRELPHKEDRGKSVGSLLAAVLMPLGLADRFSEEQARGAWREIVGEFLAAHSQPQRLKNGVLHVQVLQPTVHYELDRNCKTEIVRKLKERFGARAVRDVRFVIG